MDRGLNWELARDLNELAGQIPLVDRLAAFIATDLIFLIILSAAVWWFLPLARDRGKRAALAAAAAVASGQALNLVISHIFYVPRPFMAHHVFLLVNAAHDSSFPSDHATAAFSVAMTALLWRMPGRRFVLLGALLIAVARVYVGAHYPADVIAGAILGSLWASGFAVLDPLLTRPYGLVIGLARRVHLA